jgi:hypothetical protein
MWSFFYSRSRGTGINTRQMGNDRPLTSSKTSRLWSWMLFVEVGTWGFSLRSQKRILQPSSRTGRQRLY